MAGAKGGDYVLAVDVLKLTDDEGVRRRYKRGDTVTLTAVQAERFLAYGTVAKGSSDAGKAAEAKPGSDLVEAPPARSLSEVPGGGVLAANSGLSPDDATGGVLAEDQLNPASPAPTTEGGTPPKSAVVDVWREWAVHSGKLTEEEAAGKTKAEIQALAE